MQAQKTWLNWYFLLKHDLHWPFPPGGQHPNLQHSRWHEEQHHHHHHHHQEHQLRLHSHAHYHHHHHHSSQGYNWAEPLSGSSSKPISSEASSSPLATSNHTQAENTSSSNQAETTESGDNNNRRTSQIRWVCKAQRKENCLFFSLFFSFSSSSTFCDSFSFPLILIMMMPIAKEYIHLSGKGGKG